MRFRALVFVAALALVVAVPAAAHAATVPANGSVAAGFPTKFSTSDVVGSTTAKFYVDGVAVASAVPRPVWVWDEESGDSVVSGWSCSASAVVADGPHALQVRQGTEVRYSGTFTADGDPKLLETWWGGDGIYFRFQNNGTNSVTANVYPYSMVNTLRGGAVAVSSSTSGGITTYVRRAPVAWCDALGAGLYCDVFGLSLRLTEGYSYAGDNFDMDNRRHTVEAPTCGHYGDPSGEAASDHEVYCLGL